MYLPVDNNNLVAGAGREATNSWAILLETIIFAANQMVKKMKKMVCPQCKIAAMYVKNETGERRLVYVTSEGEVIPKKEDESLEGFNLEEVFCLGCSWHGSPKRMVRY